MGATSNNAKLTPAMESALAILDQYGTRTNGQGIALGTARALHKRNLATLTETGKGAWILEPHKVVPVPTFDEFVSATSGAVRASLTRTQDTQESASEEFQPTHRVTWYVNGMSDRKYENVILLSQDTHTDYGFLYGTARVIAMPDERMVRRFGQTGPKERTIHFGLYEARAIEPIAPKPAQATDQPADTQESASTTDGHFFTVVQKDLQTGNEWTPREVYTCGAVVRDQATAIQVAKEHHEATGAYMLVVRHGRDYSRTYVWDSRSAAYAARRDQESGEQDVPAHLHEWERDLLAGLPVDESAMPEPHVYAITDQDSKPVSYVIARTLDEAFKLAPYQGFTPGTYGVFMDDSTTIDQAMEVMADRRAERYEREQESADAMHIARILGFDDWLVFARTTSGDLVYTNVETDATWLDAPHGGGAEYDTDAWRTDHAWMLARIQETASSRQWETTVYAFQDDGVEISDDRFAELSARRYLPKPVEPVKDSPKPGLRPMTPERIANREAREERAARRAPFIAAQEPGIDYEDLAIDMGGVSPRSGDLTTPEGPYLIMHRDASRQIRSSVVYTRAAFLDHMDACGIRRGELRDAEASPTMNACVSGVITSMRDTYRWERILPWQADEMHGGEPSTQTFVLYDRGCAETVHVTVANADGTVRVVTRFSEIRDVDARALTTLDRHENEIVNVFVDKDKRAVTCLAIRRRHAYDVADFLTDEGFTVFHDAGGELDQH
ncbi:hypothetical protein AB0K16_22180 [Nonomuraea jabiensis]|uniref:hypothetical protein n=1 Tax=Nonomuraea jabiensis TaxID=882448 RepID=UPI0034368B57